MMMYIVASIGFISQTSFSLFHVDFAMFGVAALWVLHVWSILSCVFADFLVLL